MYVHDGNFIPDYENRVEVRFFYGKWFKRVVGDGSSIQTQGPATREEIMMVLQNMELLLIRYLLSCIYLAGIYSKWTTVVGFDS